MHSHVHHAISFAARAHQHQLRKDGVTPYAAHPMRVLFICRDLFGVTDPTVLAAAVLHDTLEDTPTDYDELKDHFGEEVARIVAGLSKDSRLPEQERERAYAYALANGGSAVILCKLADMYDNLLDSLSLPHKAQDKTYSKVRAYLNAIRPAVERETEKAFKLVEDKLQSMSVMY